MSKNNTKVIQLSRLNNQEIINAKKLFPSNKNYILKEVQLRTKNELLTWLVDYVKEYYETFYNPLRLIDTTIETIRSAHFENITLFDEFTLT